MRYADAGVNIAAADQVKSQIRRLACRTFTKEVLEPIGGFGGLYALERKRWREPVLVASADGVGTKLKVATAAGVHTTIGADIVHHSVNDILTQGAKPLFFLDYLAMGKLEPAIVEQVVEGISRACRQVGCALIGGETAEMPGFYPPGEYDLAGFIVGVVERGRRLDVRNARGGDALVGLPSSGLHTNGYSLARKLIFEQEGLKPSSFVREIGNKIGAELLKPHRCYLGVVQPLIERGWVAAMAHITGGGISGNLPRALPRQLHGVVDCGSWPVPAIFSYLARLGKLSQAEQLATFNLGVGAILVIPAGKLKKVEADLKRRREKFYLIGRVASGSGPVKYTGALAS